MNKISAVIIAKNEEKNLPRCLSALTWADEIVVVDTGSSDRTKEIVVQFGCRLCTSDWLGFGLTKQFAVEKASNNWVLVVDADEEVTKTLQVAIKKILQNPQYVAYRVLRCSYYLGRLIRYSGWQHDYTLRLFNRNEAAFNELSVHESVRTDKPIGKIDAILLHHTYPTLEMHLQKMELYANLGAENLFKKGKKSSILMAILRGVSKFFKMYLLKKGFLDGKEGLVLAIMSSFGVFLKYLKLWEKCNR